MIKRLLLLPLAIAFTILTGCDSSNSPKAQAVEILVPEIESYHESYNTVYLVAKVDDAQSESYIEWEYSTDQVTWHTITVSATEKNPFKRDDNFSYDVQSWIPETDNVKDKKIYIKAYDYSEQTLFDGPYHCHRRKRHDLDSTRRQMLWPKEMALRS